MGSVVVLSERREETLLISDLRAFEEELKAALVRQYANDETLTGLLNRVVPTMTDDEWRDYDQKMKAIWEADNGTCSIYALSAVRDAIKHLQKGQTS